MQLKFEFIDGHSTGDLLVVNAARASFGKESVYVTAEDAYTDAIRRASDPLGKQESLSKLLNYKSYCETLVQPYSAALTFADFNLINYLARERHMLPFRHPHVSVRCRAPIFMLRQLGKHQVGMTWSEESRRYITDEVELYWPEKWRKKADNVKQGSSDEEIDLSMSAARPETVGLLAVEAYKSLIELGVAPEQARMILPQNMMVTWVWTGSLLSWWHLFHQRSELHTQAETRDFAHLVDAEMSKEFPASWQALKDTHTGWTEVSDVP